MRPDEDPAEAWQGKVVRLALPEREFVEPTRRSAAGESFWVEKGEPLSPVAVVLVRRAEGKVVEKMLERGLGSVTTGEPQALPAEARREPREGDKLLAQAGE